MDNKRTDMIARQMFSGHWVVSDDDTGAEVATIHKDYEHLVPLFTGSVDLLGAIQLAESALSTYAATGAFTPGQPSEWLLGKLRAAIAAATQPAEG